MLSNSPSDPIKKRHKSAYIAPTRHNIPPISIKDYLKTTASPQCKFNNKISLFFTILTVLVIAPMLVFTAYVYLTTLVVLISFFINPIMFFIAFTIPAMIITNIFFAILYKLSLASIVSIIMSHILKKPVMVIISLLSSTIICCTFQHSKINAFGYYPLVAMIICIIAHIVILIMVVKIKSEYTQYINSLTKNT